MQLKKQQLELDMEQQTGSKSGKEYIKAVTLPSRLTILYIVILLIKLICRVHHANTGLDETQVGIEIARRNINNIRYADDTTLMEESKEEIKSLLMNLKELSEKVDLKLNIQKTKIMASGPITSWQIDGETMERVRDFVLFGSKFISDGPAAMKLKDACSLEKKL